VVESSNRSFCLVIDELLGKQEVVIKSLGHLFADVPGLAGGAILADGKVGLLLDPEAILESAHRAA
jgi:two-component system chemotaxis sensor kinase CheA